MPTRVLDGVAFGAYITGENKEERQAVIRAAYCRLPQQTRELVHIHEMLGEFFVGTSLKPEGGLTVAGVMSLFSDARFVQAEAAIRKLCGVAPRFDVVYA